MGERNHARHHHGNIRRGRVLTRPPCELPVRILDDMHRRVCAADEPRDDAPPLCRPRASGARVAPSVYQCGRLLILLMLSCSTRLWRWRGSHYSSIYIHPTTVWSCLDSPVCECCRHTRNLLTHHFQVFLDAMRSYIFIAFHQSIGFCDNLMNSTSIYVCRYHKYTIINIDIFQN